MASLSPQISSVLALDTASPFPAVSLLKNGVASSERLSSDRRASEELLPAIERLFANRDYGTAIESPSARARLVYACGSAGDRVDSSRLGVEVEPVPTPRSDGGGRRGAPERVAAALDAGRGEIRA
jgi:hypothetical protein